MLQIAHIRENKEQVIAALSKINIDAREMIDNALYLDKNRSKTQVELDNILA